MEILENIRLLAQSGRRRSRRRSGQERRKNLTTPPLEKSTRLGRDRRLAERRSGMQRRKALSRGPVLTLKTARVASALTEFLAEEKIRLQN